MPISDLLYNCSFTLDSYTLTWQNMLFLTAFVQPFAGIFKRA